MKFAFGNIKVKIGGKKKSINVDGFVYQSINYIYYQRKSKVKSDKDYCFKSKKKKIFIIIFFPQSSV